MTSSHVLNSLEYNKIIEQCVEYAVLEETKSELRSLLPETTLSAATYSLNKTTEAFLLLFRFNAAQIPYFDDVKEELSRVSIGGVLSMEELLKIAVLLRAARSVYGNILKIDAEEIVLLREIAQNLFFDERFEREIFSKILSENQMSDSASTRLSDIRQTIKLLNNRIRNKLNSYLTGEKSKYLQDAVVTVRGDRFVLPVKAEYRSAVKGLIHDQSSTGATLFIEPEQVVEYNNALKTALLDEQNEIQRILAEFSVRVSEIADRLLSDIALLVELDLCYAKANYGYRNHCTLPILNQSGIVDFKRGRHPLIARNKVVPVSVRLGKDYRFLLITGPNTGGKTVTLKLTGLFCAMAASGFYLPCEKESQIAVFDSIFCDVGDEQSIEQSLSTFSSHIKNIIEITRKTNERSLVLIDEIGAGTDPEEGSALALAIIEKMLQTGCAGIVTTHYSKLKEFAMTNRSIENASMDFDANTFEPLYRLNIGTPGTSNAIEIARRLGLANGVIERATEYLSDRKISFENVLREAERARHNAEETRVKAERFSLEKEDELNLIREERKALQKERERIHTQAKAETRKLVAERVSEADELLSALEELLLKQDLSQGDVIHARTLKNRIENSRYLQEDTPAVLPEYIPARMDGIKNGDTVYVQSLEQSGTVRKISGNKIIVCVGGMELTTGIENLYCFTEKKKSEKDKSVRVKKNISIGVSVPFEVNLLGKTVSEGVSETEALIDRAMVAGIKEIKIIHGFGTGRLRAGIWNYLKTNRNVSEFRGGRYGEGEMGVTIVTLK